MAVSGTIGSNSQRRAGASIIFDEPIRESMISDASGNVGLLQRFAETICRNPRIYFYQSEVALITDLNVVRKCREHICASQERRYFGFVELVGRGFKDAERTKLKMYRHLVRVCLEAEDEDLLKGIEREVLLSRIQTYESEANLSVLSAALVKLDRLRAERGVSPIILSYRNLSRKVLLVDGELLFFRRHTTRMWPWSIPRYDEEIASEEL